MDPQIEKPVLSETKDPKSKIVKSPNLQSPSGFTPGPLKKLFVDRRDVRFWEVEGQQHSYLYWVRAMVSEQVEPPPFDPHPQALPRKVGEEKEDARARRAAFGFLATAWSYPSAEMLASFAVPEFRVAVTDAWTRLVGDAAGVQALADLSPAALDDLREQYTRLFYDTYLPCLPPYESVYYNERQVMGKRAGAVIEFYRRAGLAAEGDLPDHIAHECEFIAHLAGEEIAAREAGDAARAESRQSMQDEFLREHLLPWGVKFCADLGHLARGDFYQTTARMGNALFNAEWARLQ